MVKFFFRYDMFIDFNDFLVDQNIKDRYYGMSDLVVVRLFKQVFIMSILEFFFDKFIIILYVGGLEGKVEESDLR